MLEKEVKFHAAAGETRLLFRQTWVLYAHRVTPVNYKSLYQARHCYLNAQPLPFIEYATRLQVDG